MIRPWNTNRVLGLLRDMASANGPNNGKRPLSASILHPEVLAALREWVDSTNGLGTLIGGVALSHYVKPRLTQDIDLLFLGASGVPTSVLGFKRTRPGAFQHNKTHVEVEVLTPESVNMSRELATWIVDRGIIDYSLGRPINVASPSGLVASKLGRLSRQDAADIENLCTHYGDLDLNSAPLTQKQMDAFVEIHDGLQR